MTQVILSYGMGVDSTAILLRWIEEPETRPCPLDELVVITSMTGNEFTSSGALVREHVLPRMRAHGIRYVQVAKGGRFTSDGIVVLDDSTEPTELHLDGAYKLSDEMVEAATIPTTGGTRKCSLKFKGYVLDEWIEGFLDGAPYTHVIGFAKGEERRVEKDQTFGTVPGREPSYPLIDWGWDRAACVDYIESVTGVRWRKSACVFCPFARPDCGVQSRWKEEPEEVARALEMEEIALRFNPRMKLFKTRSMRELVERSGNIEALRRFKELSTDEARPWAVYRMRRVFKPSKKDATRRGYTGRKIEKIFDGSRAEVVEELACRGEVEDHVVKLRTRREGYPAVEEFLVAAPAVVTEKSGRGFDAAWIEVMEMLEDPMEAECPCCGETATGIANVDERFGLRYNRTKPQSYCRPCRNKAARERRKAKREAEQDDGCAEAA